MKVVQINAVCGTGSTGRICQGISEVLTQQGIENYILYASGQSSYPLSIKYASDFEIKLQALKSRIFGNYGFNSRRITKCLIEHLAQINPDIIHLHNLHGHNCHLGTLCDWIRHHQKKVVLTQHDCWAFTAYCPYFTLCKCDKWKACCSNCPQYKNASWFIDRSRELYERKEAAFDGLGLTVVTPSQWLADLTKSSFLGKFPIKVINNGIDLSVFKPTDSDFRERYMLKDKTILLGVAHQWSYRKGLDVFVDLSKVLDPHYQIVLVGTDAKIRRELPTNIIAVDRTNSCKELAEIYTAADYFINPTREENFPTVNIESLACGTPVITFNTGGSPEIPDDKSGIVCTEYNAHAIVKILNVLKHKAHYAPDGLTRGLHFDQQKCFSKYIELYTNLLSLDKCL